MLEKVSCLTDLKNSILGKSKFIGAKTRCNINQQSTIAQKANYAGTGILNLEKSKLEHRPDGLTSSVFVIEQDGDKFKLTRYHIFGDKKKKISFKMIADAKTRKIKVLFKGKLEWKEDALEATLWRKNFLNIVNYKF